MQHFKLEGTGVALVTPFHDDQTIDYQAFGRLIDTVIEGGADFLVALGTTAETPTLTPTEKTEVARFVVSRTAGRVPLVLGVGSNCTADVCEQLRHGLPEGYSAVLSVVPFYNKPTQRGLLAHFTAVADASPLPVILYNIPGRSGVNMTAETTLALAKHPNIIGVKEASGDIGQMRSIIDAAPEGFRVISGDDGLTLDLMAIGGSGVISVIANAMPAKMVQLTRSMAAGRRDDAEKADAEMKAFYKPLFADGNPAGIKSLLSIMGLCTDTMRLPLVPVTEPTRSSLAEAAANAGIA